MPTPRSRVTADVRRLELTSKVHVEPLLSVEHLDGVKKHASPTTFANCHPPPAVLKRMYESMMSGEYMSGPYLESQLSLCPCDTDTSAADHASDRLPFTHDRLGISHFPHPLASAHRPIALHRSTILPYVPNLALFPRKSFSVLPSR